MSKKGKPKWMRAREEGWFELTEYFDAQKAKRVNPDHRFFFRGKIDDLTIVEADKDISSEQMYHMAKYLRDHGLNSLIVPSNIRFIKLRRCSASEERMLDAKDKEAQAQIVERGESGDGPGPVYDGDGAGGDGSSEESSAQGSDPAAEDDGEDSNEAHQDSEASP